MQLVRSDTYREDLETIVEYIAGDNASAALAVWDAIEGHVEQLIKFPYSGREGRVPRTRELVVARTPYIVVYAVSEAIILLRVLHGARQWPNT